MNGWIGYSYEVYDGDVLCIKLDLSKQQIKFIINEKNQGVAYPNVIKKTGC